MAKEWEELYRKRGYSEEDIKRVSGYIQARIKSAREETEKWSGSVFNLSKGFATVAGILYGLIHVITRIIRLMDRWLGVTKAVRREYEEMETAAGIQIADPGASNRQVKALNRYAHAMSLATDADASAIRMSMRLAAAQGVKASQLKATTNAALGLSYATGMDLRRATVALASAQQGHFSQLQRYIPALRTATSNQARWAEVMRTAEHGLKRNITAGRALSRAWADFRSTLKDSTFQLLNNLGVFRALSGAIRMLTALVRPLIISFSALTAVIASVGAAIVGLNFKSMIFNLTALVSVLKAKVLAWKGVAAAITVASAAMKKFTIMTAIATGGISLILGALAGLVAHFALPGVDVPDIKDAKAAMRDLRMMGAGEKAQKIGLQDMWWQLALNRKTERWQEDVAEKLGDIKRASAQHLEIARIERRRERRLQGFPVDPL